MAKTLKCCGCKDRFDRESMIQLPAGWFHGMNCAVSYSMRAQEKQRAKQIAKANASTKIREKAERAQHRARKEGLKSVRQLKKEAQPIFNKYIRIRDKDEDCISCSRTNAEVEVTDGWKIGGAWDCGHYLSVGAHEELRFEPRNAYKQCKSCNGGSGQYTKKNHTVSKQYRINLIVRVGMDTVDWLEGPHVLPHWKADDIRDIKTEFRSKTKELLLLK